MRRLQRVAEAIGVATLALSVWFATGLTGAAGAAARYRSGTVRAQLVNHVAATGSSVPTRFVANGADVIAGFVAVAAVVAFAFVVMTLIRRRTTVG